MLAKTCYGMLLGRPVWFASSYFETEGRKDMHLVRGGQCQHCYNIAKDLLKVDSLRTDDFFNESHMSRERFLRGHATVISKN